MTEAYKLQKVGLWLHFAGRAWGKGGGMDGREKKGSVWVPVGRQNPSECVGVATWTPPADFQGPGVQCPFQAKAFGPPRAAR